MAEQQHLAAGGVIKPGYQIDEGGFAASGAADDAHRLAGGGGKADAGQAFAARALVGKVHILEGHGGRALHRLQRFGGGIRHGSGGVQNLVHPHAAGQRPGHRHHQIRHPQQIGQNLGHIIDERDDLALCQIANADLHAALPQQRHDAQIHNEVGHGIQQRRNAPRPHLNVLQVVVGAGEGVQLIRLPGEGPHHAGAHVIFAGQQRHLVQRVLRVPVDGHGGVHDAVNDQRDDHRHHQKQQRQSGTDAESKNQRSDDDEGGAQQQPQRHVDAVLHLIHVAGHACDQRGRADAVQLGVAESVDMAEQVPPQRRAKAQCAFGRKILGCQTAGESHHRQQHHQAALLPDIHCVVIFDAHINDVGHHQRHQQFKACFQHFEQRGDDGFFFVTFNIPQELFHVSSPFCKT